MPSILLVDNGSTCAESTRGLRQIAAQLQERLAEPVHPVSLLHSNKIPSDQLDGVPAQTFEPTLRRLIEEGERDVLLIPLFFGPSRALSHFVPETASALEQVFGALRLRIAPVLCPLPAGEPRLAQILADHVEQTAQTAGIAADRVLVVDHGSPVPEVTAVRHWLTERLRDHLDTSAEIGEAVMERRPGADYDFNGQLLEDRLHRMAAADPASPVILAMLFLSAGKHAGHGGDITAICNRVQRRHPGFQVHRSPLVGGHPGLIEILVARRQEAHQNEQLNPEDRGNDDSAGCIAPATTQGREPRG
jgi:sirohydrochlorin ferrochelatase